MLTEEHRSTGEGPRERQWSGTIAKSDGMPQRNRQTDQQSGQWEAKARYINRIWDCRQEIVCDSRPQVGATQIKADKQRQTNIDRQTEADKQRQRVVNNCIILDIQIDR